MRHPLLVSALFVLPALSAAAQTCPVPSVSATSRGSDLQPVLTPRLPVSAGDPPRCGDGGQTMRTLAAPEIARIPALKRIASHGAVLTELGTEHGLRTIFARNGDAFQVFYLAPDGEAVVGGVMWDATGHDITRDQVAPIPGTIPTVKIGTDVAPAGRPTPASVEVPAQLPLKVIEATTHGTIGSPTAPRLWMFVDPMCAFSVRAMQALQPYVNAGRVQLAVIPLSVLDYEDQGRSTPAAELMLSEPADKMVAAWTGHQLTGTPPATAAAVLQANMAAASSIRLRGTPTFFWRKADGSAGRSDGIPNDFAGMIASIYH